MIYPNKHIRLEESIIYKMTSLIDGLDAGIQGVVELYYYTKKSFENMDEYLIALDVLFVLDIVEIDFNNQLVIYVDRS